MKYDPRSAISCLPEGTYEATIEKAEETTSKAGKDMVVMHFKVYSNKGETVLKEYIVGETLFKLKRIAQAIGGEAAFDKGEFVPEDYQGRNLSLELTVEEDPEFGDKNRIKRYQKLERKSARPAAKQSARAFDVGQGDDDIPF